LSVNVLNDYLKFFSARPGIFLKKPDKQIKTNMKKQGLKKRMAMMLILLVGWHMTARPGVIITGILDGTLSGGCPKAIELFITGTENLNYFEIWRSLNGAPFGSGTGAISSLSGVYTNTFVYLVKTDHVNAFIDVFGNEGIFANVLPLGIINGNGNDGFQIRRKVGSVVIDQVWLEDPTDSYVDSYWYRKHGTGPDGGWLPSAWETPGNDALDDLDQDGLQAAVPFGTYAMAWQGLTVDWNDPGNWSLGIIPSFQTNVLISDTAANFPVIANLPENPAVCMNLTVTDTARLTVSSGKALTIFGNLYLEIQSPGDPDRGLILESDSNSTQSGSVILQGYSSGTAIIKRYLDKDNSWHFLSSPVTVQNLQPEFVPDPIDQSFDLYYWDENSPPDAGWINIRDEIGQWNPQFENVFIPGKGYLVSYSAGNAGDMTRKFNGLLNSGNQEIEMGHSQNDWNLLGNPYSCALDWSSGGVDKSVVAAGAMYIWDPSLNDDQGGYRAHNGITGVPEGTTAIIPAMQGFFVQSLDTGNLSVDISVDDPLVHGNQAFYKQENDLSMEHIRLRICKDFRSDETLIYFNPAASNYFDPAFDAVKLFNGKAGCPEIFTLAGTEHPLCINILENHPASVPLGISDSEKDTLVLTAFDYEAISAETGIFLEDHLFNILINLREQPEYRFYHDPLLADNRLTLHFMNAAKQEEPGSIAGLEFWYSGNKVHIVNPNHIEGEISVYSLDGRCVESFKNDGENAVIRLSLPGGMYILRLSASGWASSQKILIY
jgi:hypothetical protein